jgi:ABC-2 type transport system permease protein
MTAATISAPAREATGGGTLTGTGTLLRFSLRRDRIRLPVWVLALGFIMATAPSTYVGLYPTAEDRATQGAVIAGNPAMKAMTGPGFGIDNYTYGAMMANEYLGFVLIFVGLMSAFIVVRHTRNEEETGRAELVRANAVGRHAHLAAALLTAAIASVALGLIVALGMGASDVDTIDWPGSLLFGATFTVTGLIFAGVAAITAQVFPFSRAASGVAGVAIGLAYTLRALGDTADNGLSWLSPIGWMQQTRVYVANLWWPMLLGLAAASVLMAISFTLIDRRDLGAGLRAERTGAAAGSARLGTPGGFAWRLHRASVIWWAIAMFLLGTTYGSATEIMDSYADNEVIQQMMQAIGGGSLTESWMSMICAIVAVVATIFSVIAALRARREETDGRAEAVLATGLSRARWLGSHVVVAMAGGLLMLLASGLGLGLGAAAGTGDSRWFADLLTAQLAYAPALWATAALAVAVFGLVPRANGLSWVLLGWSVLATYFGGLLQLPQWSLDLSPYHHIPRMPAAEFTAPPLIVLTLIAAALIAAGIVGFRHRDLEAP